MENDTLYYMAEFEDILTDMAALSDKTDGKTAGKNSRSEITAYGYNFDSKEELDVYEWISEAKELGFVESFTYQPNSFELYGGYKNNKGKYVVRPHIYTADFRILFTDKWIEFRKANKIKMFDKFDEKTVYIDVKGSWSRFSDGRDFQINCKWVLSKFNIYVWKVIPMKLFERTWLPKNCVLTRKTKKISKKYSDLAIFEKKFEQRADTK